MTRTTMAVVVALGALLGSASDALGQASFRPRFAAQAPFGLAAGTAAGRQAVALADLDGDQRPDLVSIVPAANRLRVQRNDGHGAFAAATAYALALTPTAVAVADVGSPAGAPDGHPDLLVAGGGALQVLTGDGTGAFAAGSAQAIAGASRLLGLAPGTFDAVAGTDVALLDAAGVLVLCNAAGTLAPCGVGGLLAVGDDPIELVTGDVTGDGHADLAALDRATQRVWLLRGAGDGTFAPAAPFNVAGETSDEASVDLAVARVDDDGIDDLVIINDSDNFQFLGVTLLGSATRPRTLAFVVDFEAAALAVADFDGDGASDVIVGYGDSGITVNIGAGAGALADPFVPVGSNSVGALGLALAGDLDGDEAPDLVLVHAGGDSARVLLNVTAPYCVGDCNANGAVTIEELMRGVNILLGESDPRDCIALDADGNQRVTVDELVGAVNGALDGCPTG